MFSALCRPRCPYHGTVFRNRLASSNIVYLPTSFSAPSTPHTHTRALAAPRLSEPQDINSIRCEPDNVSPMAKLQEVKDAPGRKVGAKQKPVKFLR